MESCNSTKINENLFSEMCRIEKEEAFKDFLTEIHPSCLVFQPSTLYSQYMKKIQSIKPLLSDVQVKARDKDSRKTEPQKATQYKNIIRLYRKVMSLPDDGFDKDVIITSREGDSFFSSKELLSLFSEYFERILNSSCQEGQKNASGYHEITLDLSSSAVCTLLNYFSSKKIIAEDVKTLLEVFDFANMILKGSLQRDVLKKLIPYLIKKENRNYFSRRLFSSTEKNMKYDFIKQYLEHRNIKTKQGGNSSKNQLRIAIGDFIKLFEEDGPIEDLLSKHISGLTIGDEENYATIPFYPQRYLDNIIDIEYKDSYKNPCNAYTIYRVSCSGQLHDSTDKKVYKNDHSVNYKKIESDCKKIIMSFPKLRTICLSEEKKRSLLNICAENKNVPFINAILGYAQSIGAQKSLECLQRAALQIPQNHFKIRFGSLYFATRDSENAEKCFKEALEDTPDCAFANAKLGIYYLDQNKLDLAEEYLQKAFTIDPREEAVVRGMEMKSMRQERANESR